MDTIEFFSSVYGLADAVPIIPANKYRADWMAAARADWIETKNKKQGKIEHVFQCPGIFDLFNQGFIIPMWHDAIIKTDGLNKSFSWSIPSGILKDMKGGDVIATHKPGLDKFIPKKPNVLEQVVKINTPWHVIAPKGVKFLVLPIAYPDDFDFESSIGILDPGISSEINVQLFWNLLKGERLIKAGTPIAHLIPLTEKQYELVVRDMTDNDRRWLAKREFFNNFNFRINRSAIKDFYYKHFGNK